MNKRHFKGCRGVLRRRVKERYPLIKARSSNYTVRLLCDAFEVHPSGYCQCLHKPLSNREIEDEELIIQIKDHWIDSGGHSGYRDIHLDLIEAKIDCGRGCVLRLMKSAGIKAIRGYKVPKTNYSGMESPAEPNLLDGQFDLQAPNLWWVSDITYIHTHERFLFLAVVRNLYARNIFGRAMGSRMTADLVLDALTMPYWRRKPSNTVMLHSDQGSQYSSRKCRKLLTT